MKTIFAILISMLAITFAKSQAVFAFGNDETWQAGWGMGISEAVINKGPGNQIYIACGTPTLDQSVSSIRFTLVGDGPKSSQILLTFEGGVPESVWLTDGEVQSNSRAGAYQFEYLIVKFKQKQWVNVRFEDGLNATFSLKGASDAIGECKADFWQ